MSRIRTALVPWLLAVALLGAAPMLAACGEDDESGCPSEGASVDGVAGAVYSPNCAAPISTATVSLMNGAGTTMEVTTNANGEFALPSAMLGATGIWRISVSKGPFSGETRDVEVSADGKSSFVVLTLNTGS